jgi:hypothetical protein
MKMSKCTHIVSIGSLVIILAGCASMEHPLTIGVSSQGFAVGDQVLTSRATLRAAIEAQGATSCRVVPAKDADYKQVEQAVLALQDAHCSSGMVGSMSPH